MRLARQTGNPRVPPSRAAWTCPIASSPMALTSRRCQAHRFAGSPRRSSEQEAGQALDQLNGIFALIEQMRSVDTSRHRADVAPARRRPAPARRRSDRGRRAQPPICATPRHSRTGCSWSPGSSSRAARWHRESLAGLAPRPALPREISAAELARPLSGAHRTRTAISTPSSTCARRSRWRRPARADAAHRHAARRGPSPECRSRTRTSSSPGTSARPPPRAYCGAT